MDGGVGGGIHTFTRMYMHCLSVCLSVCVICWVKKLSQAARRDKYSVVIPNPHNESLCLPVRLAVRLAVHLTHKWKKHCTLVRLSPSLLLCLHLQTMNPTPYTIDHCLCRRWTNRRRETAPVIGWLAGRLVSHTSQSSGLRPPGRLAPVCLRGVGVWVWVWVVG